jgi:hypothetical protein
VFWQIDCHCLGKRFFIGIPTSVVGASLLAINPVATHRPSLAGKLLQKPKTIDIAPSRLKA